MIAKSEFGEIVHMATDTIRGNKMRSALTVLLHVWPSDRRNAHA